MTTGRALVKRVLSQPDLRSRYESLRLVPWGARALLDVVAELVAGSGEALELRLDPEKDGDGYTLIERITDCARAAGGEAEFKAYLDILVRRGFLLWTEEGGLRLALPPKKPTTERKASSSRANGSLSAGRPPAGISEEEYAAKIAARRETARAERRQQTTLMLPVAGGVGAGAADGQTPITHGVTHGVTQGVTHGETQAGLAGEPKVAAGGFGLGFAVGSPLGLVASRAPGLAAAAEVQDSRDSAAAAPVPPRTRPAAAAAEPKTEPKPKPNGEPKPKPTSPAELPESGLSAMARELAREGAQLFGWSSDNAAEAPSIIEHELLGRGFTAAQVREAFASKRERRAKGARYFGPVLRQLYPEVVFGAAPGATADCPVSAVTPAIRPDVAAHPRWSGLSPKLQRDIGRVLEVTEMPPSPERGRLLSALKSIRGDAVQAVAAERPDLQEELGWDPASDAQGRDTGPPRSAVG